MTTLDSFRITSIRLGDNKTSFDSPVPVIVDGRAAYYENTNPIIWATADGAIPTSIDASSTFQDEKGISFLIKAKIPFDDKLSEAIDEQKPDIALKGIFQGLYGLWGGDGPDPLSLEADLTYSVSGIALWNFVAGADERMKRNEPWAFEGEVSWELSCPLFPSVYTFTTPLRIYAVCPGVVGFLRREGIPHDLLRFSLKPDARFLNLPYDQAITQRVFNSGFVYERESGATDYCPGGGAGSSFELEKWLLIWTVLDGTASEKTKSIYHLRGYGKDGSGPKVKCYDQAGILGICLSLGFQTPGEISNLKSVFMEPFGFLKNGPLVGFDGRCNNPYKLRNRPDAKERKDLWVDPLDEMRSRFRNHVFLTWNERVYDACAGPVYGDCDILGYLNKAIDRNVPGQPPTHFGKAWSPVSGPEKWVEYTDEKDISGTPAVAIKKPLSDSRAGILGGINDSLNWSWWSSLKVPEDIILSEIDPWFGLNVADFGKWFNSKTGGSSPSFNLSGGLPSNSTVGQGVSENDQKQLAIFQWNLTVRTPQIDSNAYQVLLTWRSFQDSADAAAARSNHFSLEDDIDLDKLRTNGVLSASVGDENFTVGLQGRHTIHLRCNRTPLLDLKLMMSLTTQIMSLGGDAKDDDDDATMLVGNSPGKDQTQICNTMNVQHRSEVKYVVQVENVHDIDWTYTTGSVFLRNYQLVPRSSINASDITTSGGEQETTDCYVFSFYGRTVGEDVVEIVFYDEYLKMEKRKVKFVVGT